MYTVLKLHSALWRQPRGWCGPWWKWVWHPWCNRTALRGFLVLLSSCSICFSAMIFGELQKPHLSTAPILPESSAVYFTNKCSKIVKYCLDCWCYSESLSRLLPLLKHGNTWSEFNCWGVSAQQWNYVPPSPSYLRLSWVVPDLVKLPPSDADHTSHSLS